jgi:hypothetical protein
LPRNDGQALRRQPHLPAHRQLAGLSGLHPAIIDGGVKAVETAGNNPQKWLPALHEAGIKVIHKCTSVRHALKAAVDRLRRGQRRRLRVRRAPRRGRRSQLHPAAARRRRAEDSIRRLRRHGRRPQPGGRARLGAEGINMGTRFIATREAPVHDNVKQAIVAASELDTRLVMRRCATPNA